MSDASLDPDKLPVLETNQGHRIKGTGSFLTRVVEALPTVVVLVGAALTGWWGTPPGMETSQVFPVDGKGVPGG